MASPVAVLSHHEVDEIRSIEPELLCQRLRSGRPVVLLDVRSADELERPGERPRLLSRARRMPLRDLAMRCHELAGLEDEPIVTLSRRGLRARVAAYALGLAGFTDVAALEGGLARWVELGLDREP